MSLTAKKISAVDEVDAIADDDVIPMIDTSASPPAAKGKKSTFTKIATWIAAKFPVPNQATVEAGTSTTAGLISPQRIAQAIAELAPSGNLHNLTATRAPLGTDDNTDGYSGGSVWIFGASAWIAKSVETNIAVWLPIGGLANPMTTAEDLIIGGASGAPARLAKGANGKILGVVDGVLAWVDAPEGGGGMSNPMTTAEDLIVGGAAGAPARLAAGANGKVLGVADGAVAWVDPPEGGGGMADPMTTNGDIIYRNEYGVTTRLPIGAVGKELTVSPNGVPSWQWPMEFVERVIDPAGVGLTTDHYFLFRPVGPIELIGVLLSAPATYGAYAVSGWIGVDELNVGLGTLFTNTVGAQYQFTPSESVDGISVVSLKIETDGSSDPIGTGFTSAAASGPFVVRLYFRRDPATI